MRREDDHTEWWQDVPEELFKERLAVLEDDQLQELIADISATIAKIIAQLHGGNPDADWARRARRVQFSITARRYWVKAEITSRNGRLRTSNYERKQRHVAELRALLNAGNIVGCLNRMIDQVDPDLRGQ